LSCSNWFASSSSARVGDLCGQLDLLRLAQQRIRRFPENKTPDRILGVHPLSPTLMLAKGLGPHAAFLFLGARFAASGRCQQLFGRRCSMLAVRKRRGGRKGSTPPGSLPESCWQPALLEPPFPFEGRLSRRGLGLWRFWSSSFDGRAASPTRRLTGAPSPLLEATQGSQPVCWSAAGLWTRAGLGCGSFGLCFVKLRLCSTHPCSPKAKRRETFPWFGLLGFDGGRGTHKNNRRK